MKKRGQRRKQAYYSLVLRLGSIRLILTGKVTDFLLIGRQQRERQSVI
jgi:hypothetical protein